MLILCLSILVNFKDPYSGFGDIIITFTDQNVTPLEIEDKVNLTLLIDKKK